MSSEPVPLYDAEARFDVRREPSVEGPSFRVTVSGEIDLDTAARFHEALLVGATQPNVKVAVDLEALDFMDSSGVHALVDARKTLQANGGSLVVVAMSSPVARVLSVLGLTDVLTKDDSSPQE